MARIGPSVGQIAGIVPADTLQDQPVRLTLTHSTIRRLWFLVIVVQALYGCQLFMTSYMYIVTSHTSSTNLISFLARVFLIPEESQFLVRNGIFIGLTYLVLGLCFGVSVQQMLRQTVQSRRCSFGISSPSLSRANRSRYPVIERLREAWVRYGIRGQRFEEVFVLREFLDIMMQTAQAYTTSLAISNTAVNLTFSILIVLSAVVHPVLSRLYSRQPAMKRFACVLSEFFIDLAWGNILPPYIAIMYAPLDRTMTTDQIFKLFDYGFYEKAQREVHQLLILSWPAFFISVFPPVSALISLRSLKYLLSAAKRIDSWSESGHISSGPSQGDVVKSHRSGRRRTGRLSVMFLPQNTATSRFVHWGYVGIVIFGIGVWLVSIASTSLVPKTGRIPDGNCIHRLSPWLVADDACVVVIVHCPTLQITGRQAEMNSVLSTIHLSSLSHLLISSCNELEIPTSLSHAKTLLSLVFVNNTILDWPREIAFSSEYFPRIMNAAFIFSRLLDTPPPGLVDIPYWPRRLERVYFSYTDIDELAQRLTTQWSTVVSWIGVNCGLKTFPPVFFTMPNLKIWAVYNSTIPSIPTNRMDEVVLWPRLTYAMWTFNPQLSSIGDDLWRAAASGSMQIMSLAFTNVSTIPSQWQKSLQNARFPIHAVGSPLCSANVSILPIPAIDCNPVEYNPRNVI